MTNNESNNQEIKITSPNDCGNAPKKRVLKEFIIAFAKNDIGFITESLSENVTWNLINECIIQGRDHVVKEVENKLTRKIVELEIHKIITHGYTAAANGSVKLEDNSFYSFCNVYAFVSAGKNTIKEITSYVIKMD